MPKNCKQKRNNLLFLLFAIISLVLFFGWLGGSFFSTRQSDYFLASISRSRARMALETQKTVATPDLIDFSDKSRFVSPPQASTSFPRPSTKRVLAMARKELGLNRLGLKESFRSLLHDSSPLHHIVEKQLSSFTYGNINYRRRQNIVAGRFIVSFHLDQASKNFQEDILRQLNSDKQRLQETLKSVLKDKLNLKEGQDLDKRRKQIESQEKKNYALKRAREEVKYQANVVVKADKEGNQKELDRGEGMFNRANRILREEEENGLLDFPLILERDLPIPLDSQRAREVILEIQRTEKAIEQVKTSDIADIRTNGKGQVTGMALTRLTRSRPIILRSVMERLGVPLEKGNSEETAVFASNELAIRSTNWEFRKKLETAVDVSGGKKKKKYVNNFQYSKGGKGEAREFFDMKTPLDEMADRSTDYGEDRIKEYEFVEETDYVEPITGLLIEERPLFALEADKELFMPHKRRPIPAEQKLLRVGKHWLPRLYEEEITKEKRNFALQQMLKRRKQDIRQVEREMGEKRKQARNLSPEEKERLDKLAERKIELRKEVVRIKREKLNFEHEKKFEEQDENLELEKTGSLPLLPKPIRRDSFSTNEQNRRRSR